MAAEMSKGLDVCVEVSTEPQDKEILKAYSRQDETFRDHVNCTTPRPPLPRSCGTRRRFGVVGGDTKKLWLCCRNDGELGFEGFVEL